MKKKVALPIIISSSVVGLIVIAVIVLSVIFVNPLTAVLGGYNSVEVYNIGADSTRYPSNEDAEKAIDEGVEKTKFSIMHAILEGRFNYTPKFKLDKDDDGNDVPVKLTVSGIRNLSSDESNYMLLFKFNEVKTVKLGNKITVNEEEISELKFDRAKVLIYDTVGEIERIVIYPYLQAELDKTPTDTYYYSYAVEIWSTTSKLTNVLSDYSSYLK